LKPQLKPNVQHQLIKKTKYKSVKAKLDEMKDAIVSCDKEMKLARQAKAKLAEKKEHSTLEKKKIEGKLSRHGKEQSEMATTVQSLLKKYEWIESEEAFFGQPHTDYDFKTRNPKQVEQRIAGLEKEQSALSKCINKKVIGMLEKAEQDYKELVNKRQIIEKDKNQIENVIAELDEKKNEVLQTTWKKVNRDFGSIFSTLLPGTDAKLQPVEGTSVLDGLEVKVAFGGKFKESLTELSGGQRSLLALSLVLSLLLFKPAPMYILDEVDAALDLSHTQNIGQIIKKHFSGSQFIVVSLKEGMFNNANVIFRTKFVDGLSTVKRTAFNSKKSVSEDYNLEEDIENEFAPKIKKAKHRAGRRATKI
jgi:structural maintenance of chromosome 2